MTPLLVVLPYCEKDAGLAKELLTWIKELGPEPKHPAILLVADEVVPRETMVALNTLAKESFTHANTIAAHVPPSRQGWPAGANVLFHEACKEVADCYKWPWLWLEPDSVPLRSLWLDDLTFEYHLSPKKYVGAFVHSEQPNLPPVHMAGVGMYPPEAFQSLRQFCAGESAFDMAMADYVVRHATPTDLIQNHWGEQGLPPTFTDASQGPANAVTLDFLRPGAVLFHRCKDGSLINLLRAKNKEVASSASHNDSFQPAALFSESPKRKPGRPRKQQEPTPMNIVD